MSSAPLKSVRFTRLRLGNWKNFVHADIELKGRVFLVGPNASGKSNLLDSLRFLHDLASVGGGFQEAVRKRGGVSKLRCLAARRYPDVEIAVAVGGSGSDPAWHYELSFSQDNLQRPIIKSEVVRLGQNELLRRPNGEDNADEARLQQTYLEQVNVNRDFRSIAEFFSTIRYLHLVPQLVREPDRYIGFAQDPFGSDFMEQIAKTQERTQKSRLKKIAEALRIAVPQLQELQFFRDDSKGRPHLRGRYDHWRLQGAWQTEEQFSDGTLRLLGLLWAVLDGAGPLLLEEPELSLHADVVRFLPSMFANMQRRSGRQVFVSTHSPDLLRDDGIGLDEVVLLKPSAEGTQVTLGAKISQARELLQGGTSLPDVILPMARPPHPQQLSLFGD